MIDRDRSTAVDRDRALLDPESVFGTPEALVAHDGLSRPQRIEILRRWAYDASEDAVAQEEGMPGETSDLLQRILLALGRLTGGLDLEQVGPTKHHGIPRSAVKSKEARRGGVEAAGTADEPEADVIREAVGVFATTEALEATIDDLTGSGFDRAEISLLASQRAVENTLGRPYRTVAELEDNAAVPRRGYVSKESIGAAEGGLIGGPLYVGALAAAGAIAASGGTLATDIAGAAAAGGAGGLIGSVLAKLVGDRHARDLQEQLDRGGLVLWVRTRDAAHERSAVAILRKHSGRDVHVHALPAAA